MRSISPCEIPGLLGVQTRPLLPIGIVVVLLTVAPIFMVTDFVSPASMIGMPPGQCPKE